MDREISKEVRRKEQRKQIIKIGGGVGSGRARHCRDHFFPANQPEP